MPHVKGGEGFSQGRASPKLAGVSSPADSALMLRYQDGDNAAFEVLYRRHRGPLYRYFVRHASRALVDDLFQEVWLRVIRGNKRYRASAPFAAYLYRIAHNVLVDHYRSGSRRAEAASREPAELAAPGGAPELDVDREELRVRLSRALDALPTAQREAFLLHQEGGLTLEQIGQVVGVGRETVKSRLRYAVRRLRTELAEPEPATEKQA